MEGGNTPNDARLSADHGKNPGCRLGSNFVAGFLKRRDHLAPGAIIVVVCEAMATVAIGDIHGHLVALEDLLAKVLPTLSRSDVLAFLGDYIDKGPDARGCIDRLIAVREEAPCPVVGLLGNHDQAMLRTWKDPTSHSWIFIGGFETIESYSSKAAAAIEAEFEAVGSRIVLDKIRVGYERFFQEMPATHLTFFEGPKTVK